MYCYVCAGPMTPQCPHFKDTVAQKLAGYDLETWLKLREDRKRTYRRAADSLITQWSEFKSLIEVQT